MLQAEIKTTIDINLAATVVVAVVFGYHDVSHSVAIDVTNDDGRIGGCFCIRTGIKKLNIPRIAFKWRVAIVFKDVVGESRIKGIDRLSTSNQGGEEDGEKQRSFFHGESLFS